MKQGDHIDYANQQLWLLSFSDLSMLLLAFFVLRLSLLHQAVQPAEVPPPTATQSTPDFSQASFALHDSLRGERSRGIQLVDRPGKMILNISSEHFTDEGELSVHAAEVLSAAAAFVRERGYHVKIFARLVFPSEFREVTLSSPWDRALQLAQVAKRQFLDARVDSQSISWGGMAIERKNLREHFDTLLHRNGQLEVEIFRADDAVDNHSVTIATKSSGNRTELLD